MRAFALFSLLSISQAALISVGLPNSVISSVASVIASGPSSTSSTATAASTSTNPCYADNVNNAGRTFSAASTTSSRMTNELCQSYCSNLGYAFSGTEYSQECYCSNSISTATTSTKCTMTCGGSFSEICGGPNALSVSYNATVARQNSVKSATAALYNPYGCYSDDYPSRVLTGSSTTLSSMTVENCKVFCNSGGYTIAGVENGDQCFCGNTLLTDGSTYGIGNQAGCTYSCAGNNNEICGGANRLNVYSTGLTLATYNPQAAHVQFTMLNANGGCASDYIPAHNYTRTLSGSATSSSNMTPAVCSAFCSSYRFYGVEYATECYCGNTIASYAIVASNCTDPCAGDSTKTCGGSWAMNIYTNFVTS